MQSKLRLNPFQSEVQFVQDSGVVNLNLETILDWALAICEPED